MPTPTSSSSSKPRVSKLDPYVHLLGVSTDAEVAKISGLTPEAVRQFRKRRGIPSAAEAQAAASAEALPPEPGETVAEPEVAAPVATTATPPTARSKSKGAGASKVTTKAKAKSSTATKESRLAKKSKAGAEPNREPEQAPPSKPAARASRRARIESVRHLIGVLPDAEVAAQAGVSQTAIMIDRESRKIPEAGSAPAAQTAPNGASDLAQDDLPTEPGGATDVTTTEPEPESKGQASRAKARPTPFTGQVRRRRGAQVEDVAGPVPDVAPEPEPERETTARSKPGRKSADALLEPFRSQLGTVDDGRIAELSGLSRGVVGAYRRKHRIKAYDGYLWTAGSGTGGRVRRGEQTEEADAEAPPASSPSTKTRKPKPTKTPRTPKATAEAAPAPPAPLIEPPKRRGPPSKIDAVRDLVGQLDDATVAARVGLTRSAVQMYRRKYNIPAPTKRVAAPVEVGMEVHAAPTTKARAAPVEGTVPTAPIEQVSTEVGVAQPVPAAPSPSRPLIAWKLTLRVGGVDVEKYAITVDSASVGRIADAAGEVLRIERVGDGIV